MPAVTPLVSFPLAQAVYVIAHHGIGYQPGLLQVEFYISRYGGIDGLAVYVQHGFGRAHGFCRLLPERQLPLPVQRVGTLPRGHHSGNA